MGTTGKDSKRDPARREKKVMRKCSIFILERKKTKKERVFCFVGRERSKIGNDAEKAEVLQPIIFSLPH